MNELKDSRLKKESYSSPIKSQGYRKLQQEKKHMINRMLYLFTVFSSKASKYSYKELNQKYFMEMMEYVWHEGGRLLQRNGLDWKHISNLYYSVGIKKGSLSFNTFLSLLPQISQKLYPHEKFEESLRMMMSHLIAVYNNQVAKEIQNRVVDFQSQISEQTREFLQKLLPNLTAIYKLYFPNQISRKYDKNKKPQEESFDNLTLLLKQFQVYPKLISAAELYLLTYTVMNAELRETKGELGKYLTFPKFIEIMISISRITLPRLRQVEDPEFWQGRQKEMFKILLQYMETVRTKNKNAEFKELRFSFIVYDEYPQNYNQSLKHNQSNEQEKLTGFYAMMQKMKL